MATRWPPPAGFFWEQETEGEGCGTPPTRQGRDRGAQVKETMWREASRRWGRGRCAGDEHRSKSGLEREEWGERERGRRVVMGGGAGTGLGGSGRVSPSICFTRV